MNRPSRTARRFDVVGVGVAALDYLTCLECWPGPDEKVKTDELTIAGGGTVGTALVAAARLGARAAFAGPVGDDPCGQEVLDGLEAEGVDVRLARITPGARTTLAFCVAHGAERNVFSIRGTSPPLSLSDQDVESLLDTAVLHLDGSEEATSLTLAARARERGVTTSLDGGSLRPTTDELVEQIDLLVMSEPFLASYRPGVEPAAALGELHRPGRALTAVTLGARGALANDGRSVFEVAAEPVVAVDSTGAGDVFHGALLAGLVEGMDLKDALAFASLAASRACLALGGRAAIPSRAELTGRFPRAGGR